MGYDQDLAGQKVSLSDQAKSKAKHIMKYTMGMKGLKGFMSLNCQQNLSHTWASAEN